MFVLTVLGAWLTFDLLRDFEQAHGEHERRDALSDKPLASGHHESSCDQENVTLHANRGPGTGGVMR